MFFFFSPSFFRGQSKCTWLGLFCTFLFYVLQVHGVMLKSKIDADVRYFQIYKTRITKLVQIYS